MAPRKSAVRETQPPGSRDQAPGQSTILIVFGPPEGEEPNRICTGIADREGITLDEAWVLVVHDFLESIINHVKQGRTDLDFLFSEFAGTPLTLFGAAPTRTYRSGGVFPSLWVDADQVYDSLGRVAAPVVCDESLLSAVSGYLGRTLDTKWMAHTVMRMPPRKVRSSGTETEANAAEQAAQPTGLDQEFRDKLWEAFSRRAVMTIEIPSIDRPTAVSAEDPESPSESAGAEEGQDPEGE